MVSAKPSRPLCLAPHQRDNHGHSKRSCDHNECQQVEHDHISPNSGRKLPASRRHMAGTPYRRCQTLLGTDMDSFDGVGRDCTARVTEPVRPPARTASFDDVEVPSASATRNSSPRAKTAGAALVLRARKNGGHRQRRFSCPLGVRCLSHDCTIMRVPVSLRRKP
jgi:hypothetical protein